MKQEQTIKELDKIVVRYGNDKENTHLVCQAILLKFLAENGFKDLATKYEEISETFWYT